MSASPGCLRVQGRLERWLDGGLDPVQSALDRGHLEACAACRAELGAWEALLGEVRRGVPVPPAAVRQVVEAVLSELPSSGAAPRTSTPTSPKRGAASRVRTLLAAAALLLALAWLGDREGLLARVRVEVGGSFSATLERLPTWSQLSDGWSRLARRIS